ncbi:Retinoic acid-induced protein 1 [Acipenser ruthenus]|uniref:Retinoic acid-induced protein 1 n=1 Tax=Acipenser ruthenus TaxID=7906 RepID=A0A662Z1E6_ACIRT|nr:Retinoic acid-induced protein 1 [Acipenser ruthenus]
MQSFRERSGFHGNQQCYQQEAHELSRLENYRHHQSQTRQGYEAHAVAAAKDCYSQQVYPGYSNSTGADKQYKGAKIPTQHLQNSSSLTGYSNHLTNAYSAQYVSEGHLQQKWEDSSHLPQYEQELVGRLESPTSGGQYLEQNLHPVSRSQCSHSTQQNPPVYTTHHQQKVQQDTSTSAMTYSQGSLHFPQHSQSLSSSTPSYTVVDKCNQTSHCYKNYAMPSNSQYNRQLGSGTIKQGGYRAQTNYSYQSTPARVGYEQQAPLQAMPNTQDNLSKYQHYNQPQQNYCLTDISVRSPEQYYQNCSPSSSQSPARSVGRSPSYSSTPSPLMVNPETFQYNQPPITTGASSSTGIRDQSLLIPSHTHSSNLNPQPTSYAGSLKDRFSEKLLSNPSLWSLNALTSQVENISNNVQQLLLSEALVSNKKGGKRTPKKTEDYQGQLRAVEDGSEVQLATPASEPFSTPQSVHTEMQEGEYSSSSEEQLERIYYMCSQNSPARTTNNSQVILETVSSDSVTSPDNMSAKSDDSLHSGEPGEHFTTLLKKNLGNEKSPTSQSASSPLKQEENAAAAIIKENFEESAWPDKTRAEKEEINEPLLTGDEKGDICVVDQGGWLEEEKYPAFFHKLSKVLINKSYPNSMEQKIYQDMQIQYVTDEREDCEKPSSPAEFHCGTAAGSDVDAEMYNSDFPAELNVAGKAVQFNWSNDLVQEQYLTMKEEVSNYSKFNSGVEVFEEKLSAAEENLYIEECSVQLSESSKPAVIKDKHSSLLPEETFKHQVWMQESAECSSPEEDQDRGNQIPEPKETFFESIVQEAVFSSTERSVIRDVSPQHPSKTSVLVTPDETTPLSQTSDNSDLEDSMILAHDIPLLAVQSVIHSASSWADTPPSSKKWDEEIELGTDCLDEVPESFESESLNAPAKLNELNRKHDEEKTNQPGRLMHTSVRIRRLSSLVGEGLPTAPQVIIMSSSKYTTSADQTEATSNNLSSQIPKSFAENPPSRMCTRSFTAQGVPKACVHIKRQSAPSLPKTASSKDLLCHPTDMLSKIKCLKHKGLKSIEGCIKGKRSLSECCPNGEGQDGTQSILPLLKEQRPMVLRSRKQKQEKPLKEKVKEKRMPNLLPRKLKTPHKQKAVFLKGKARASPKQNTADSHRKVMYRIKNKTEKPAENLLSALKRKSNGCSPIPVKRHRGVKQGKGEALLDPLNNKEVVAKTPNKKSQRGAHFKTSLNSYLTKELPLVVSSVTPCVQAQYPAKTKYLPPRKGRGLKYEAMVQKITSPGSKKNAPSTYAENTVANPTTALQSHEENEQIKEAQQLKPRADAESQNVIVELEGNKSPPSKRRQLSVGKICVSRSQIASAFETEVNLVVGPRLAKQRAIKNNHEMHMKQRRRRRKGIGSTVPEDNVVADQHSSTPLLALPPLETELSTPTPVTVETSTCKRVNQRLSHPKKKQVKYLDNKNRQNQKTVKKTGTVRRNRKHLDAVKTKENGCRLKNQHKKQRAPIVEDKEPEIRLKYVSYKPQKNENKPPQFCPYIHIDKSKELSSICNIVNRPEEACQLLQTRKNNSPRIKNSVAVAKVIPNSSVMQQGPLINKNLIDRCLTCCLCRKPANYRELGDLCGPYYPEDSIPRKTQSFKCKTELGENRVKMLCSSVQSEATEPETEKSSSSVVPGRPRRLDKLPGEHPGVRSKFRDRYRKLHQFQGYNRKAVDAESNPLKEQDCSGPVSQHLELEVDSKEHWVHEACVVWTNGAFLVAGKLYGLQEAVLVASETNCLKCLESGATVGCCSKGCTQKFHYVCAKDMVDFHKKHGNTVEWSRYQIPG